MITVCHAIRQMYCIAKKEWVLLGRNRHGLAVLFLMPAVFVLIMSFTLKNSLTSTIDMPVTGWVLEDDSSQAERWMREWHARYGGRFLSERSELRLAMKSGDVQAGVVLRSAWWMSAEGMPDAGKVEIWLDNKTQPATAARLRTELTFSMLAIKMHISAVKAGPFSGVLLGNVDASEFLDAKNMPEIRYTYEIDSGRKITAVQQTVPAWLIFGMFFVVVPIAGVLIQERNEGTLARLLSFGVSYTAILGGKLLAFMVLNWVQLAFMLIIGAWILPWLGADALKLDISFAWFIGIVAVTSAAAVCLALVIAAYTRTFDHAAALGSGINVALAAIAGVLVPRMLMPSSLQTISESSPMGWALDGMQTVFLGKPDAQFMLVRIGLLLLFASVCFVLSWRKLHREHS